MTEIFNRMQPLQIMEICGSDLDIRKDLLKVLPEASFDVLVGDEEEGGQDFFRVRIQKRLVR